MKKFVSIVLGVVLTLGAVALTSSCKKDINNAESLAETLWVAQDGTDIYQLTFLTSTEFKMVQLGNNQVAKGVFIITGNKTTLTGSHITLTLTAGQKWLDGGMMPLIGKFESENKIRFDEFDDDDMVFVRTPFK